jgi:hypothetical protein
MKKSVKLALTLFVLSLSCVARADTIQVDGDFEVQGDIKGNLTFEPGGTGKIAFADGSEVNSLTDLGLIWLSGSVAPADQLGDDGNLYLDTSAGEFYLRNSGSWGSPISGLSSPGTDDQNLIGASLSWPTLQIDIENGSSTSVDLTGLFASGLNVVPYPTLLTSLEVGDGPENVVVSGNYAYITNYVGDEFIVMDVSNPDAPKEVGSLTVPRAWRIAISGNYAYVVNDGDEILQVIDVRDPANPTELGSFPSPEVWDIAVSGGYVYMVDSIDNDLKVIDVSNPAAPFLAGSLAIGDFPSALVVSGSYAYVVDRSDGALRVINVSNPVAPSLVGFLVIVDSPIHVTVSGNYAYVVDDNSDDLKVIDISNPVAPALKGSLEIGGSPNYVAVSGNYAYVVDGGSNDLKVIDVSDPTAPALTRSLVIGDGPRALSISGGYAYVVDLSSDDLKVIDLGFSQPVGVTGELKSLDLSNILSGLHNNLALNGNWLSNDGDDEGVYVGTNGSVGIGTSTLSHTLTVNGDAAKTGGGEWSVFSDQRLKKDIRNFSDGLNIIEQIRPVSFKYNSRFANADDGKEYVGVIAQEVEAYAPYMLETVRVKLNENDMEETDVLMYDGSALTYILVNAVQEQQAIIDHQDAEIQILQNELQSVRQETQSQLEAFKARLLKLEDASH